MPPEHTHRPHRPRDTTAFSDMPNWKDPAVRQAALDRVLTRYQSQSLYALSEPGLPGCHRNWRTADRFAFSKLLRNVETPKELSLAFDLRVDPVDDQTVYNSVMDARTLARRIAELFPELQRILQSFEPLIRSRWNKKNQTDRTKLIKDADPKLPAFHRPDLHILRRTYLTGKFGDITEFDFTQAHNNVEDLAKGNSFLRLLNTRGRNEPATFAMCDLDTMQIGVRFNLLATAFISMGVDMFSDVATNHYGHVDLNQSLSAIETVVRQRKMALNDAVFVLATQARLLQFLKTCCEKILHDKLEILSANPPAVPEPERLPDHDGAIRSALAVASQRPYLHPHATVDFQDMLRQARAALEDAQEHIWALREDPSYFCAVVKEFRDHSREYIKDAYGNQHPHLKLPNQGFMKMLMQDMLHQVYKTVFDWELIISLLEQVAEQEPIFAKSGVRFEEDAPDFYRLLLRLRLAFDEVMLPDTIKRLCQNLVASPDNRAQFQRISPTDKRATFKHDKKAFDDSLSFLTLLGMQHLNESVEDDGPPVVPVADILLEIQRLVETKGKGQIVLTTLVVQTIAEVGLQADMRSQLSNYRPRVFSSYVGPGFDSVGTSAGPDKEAVSASVWSIHATATRLRRAVLSTSRFPNLAPYADPDRGQFTYPAHQKRTKANTAVMQTAEANLDIFWREFDNYIGERSTGLLQKMQSLSSGRELARTPDWVEPAVKSGGTRGKAAASTAASSRDLSAPFGGLSIDPSGPKEKSRLVEDAGETKKKTKGKADPGRAREPEAEQQADNVAEPAPNPVFRVSRRAMGVVDALFYQPSAQRTPGEVHWRDFLYTMGAMGFASEPGFGSAVRFTPTGEALMGLSRQDIMIHSPHPAQKMVWQVARRIGRRLTRNYGLDASFFEEQ